MCAESGKHNHFPLVRIYTVIEEFFDAWAKLENDYSQALTKANNQIDKWGVLIRYFDAETLAMPSTMSTGASRIISADQQKLASSYD